MAPFASINGANVRALMAIVAAASIDHLGHANDRVMDFSTVAGQTTGESTSNDSSSDAANS